MHRWRLADIPIAGSILLLAPLLGQASAEIAELVLVPFLTLGLALFLAGGVAWRLVGERDPFCLPVFGYVGVGDSSSVPRGSTNTAGRSCW